MIEEATFSEKQTGIKLCLGLLSLLLINWIFKFVFTPPVSEMGPYSLVNTPDWMAALKVILAHDPISLLLPVNYPDTDSKSLWWTTTLVPLYYFYQMFSAFGVYIVTSSLLVITVYLCSWYTLSSLVFSFTLGILIALGTQLNYALTMGVVLTLYILLAYIAINMTLCVFILRTKAMNWHHYVCFFISLLFCVLGSEFWLNYAVSLIIALVFLIVWERHHKHDEFKRKARILLGIIGFTVIAYLLAETHAAHKYFQAGVEEELIFTYSNLLLMIDDLIVNYFTLLYMALSNYLPSFLFFSNSATYLGEARIIAEQQGYHAQKTQLVMQSHLFEWRFFAGVFVTLFGVFGWKLFHLCWKDYKNKTSLILFILWIAVVTGFSTHLMIKMRPYNATPMLSYKVVFSTFAFSIMLAYLAMISQQYFKNAKQWSRLFAGFIIVVFLAAYTRPGAMNAGLSATGMTGYSDPVAQTRQLASKVKHKIKQLIHPSRKTGASQ